MAAAGLRVAWIIYGALEQVSGGYIYDRLVVERLRELGDLVTVVSLTPGETPAFPLDDFDALVGDELCFRELSRLFQRAPRRVRKVLLIHHLTAWEHPPGLERAQLLALERAALDAADVCVATSRVTAGRLQAERLARGVVVAEPGADRLPRPQTGGQEPGGVRLRLLFVGNIVRRKRVLELCAAVADLPTANVDLVLVGAEVEPDYAAEVRASAAFARLGQRLRFLGSLPAEALAEELALADALVLPSALEGYGMVLSEALWAAVPVIAARVGGAEQLVDSTSAGLLYEPCDAAALGATLGTFVAASELRRSLRHAAWRAADHLPRWHDTALTLRATLAK